MGKLLAAPAARRLALAAAVCAALAAGAEAGLRLAKIGAPVWHRPDPLLGWALRPYAGAHGGARYGFVNAFGQRDNPHELDKRAGVYRIAVLGDERTEALDVPLRAAWWRQLALELDRCGFGAGRKIEALNFAVGGYSTAQQALVLEGAVMRYRPDLVLVQLSTPKDVRENSRALASRLDRPFFALDERGRLRFDASFRERRDFDRRSQFRYELVRELADRSRVLQLLAGAALIDPAHAGSNGERATLGSPADARWQDAWRVTEALLERMAQFAGRNGAELAVVGAPQRAEADGDARYADARLSAFGKSHGIPYIALAPKLGNTRELYGPGDLWTVAGHRAAAQAVAAGLCRPAPSS